MADQFNVMADELQVTAKGVSTVAENLDKVVDAARHVAVDQQAYGALCAVVGLVVGGLSENSVELARRRAEGLRALAKALEGAAQSYVSSDGSAASTFNSLQDQLGDARLKALPAGDVEMPALSASGNASVPSANDAASREPVTIEALRLGQ